MAITEVATTIAKQIVAFDPMALDGMTLAELADVVQHELRDRDGLAYYVNYFDYVGNTALSNELMKHYA